jgi:hypothetical protein
LRLEVLLAYDLNIWQRIVLQQFLPCAKPFLNIHHILPFSIRLICVTRKKFPELLLVQFLIIHDHLVSITNPANKMNFFQVVAKWDNGKYSRYIIITGTLILKSENFSEVDFRLRRWKRKRFDQVVIVAEVIQRGNELQRVQPAPSVTTLDQYGILLRVLVETN